MNIWPTTSEWQLPLSTHMRNVSSVVVRSAALHASEYTVDVWNNMIDVEFGGTVYAVEVEIGMYTTLTLVAAVTAAFVATDAALSGFNVTYLPQTDSIVISEGTPSPFTILWKSGVNVNTSMWRTLGYTRSDLSSILNGTHNAVAQGRVDLQGPLAIDLFANELTNSIDGPIGRVMLQRTVDGGPIFDRNVLNNIHSFWPIGRLQFMTFKFMIQYGHINENGTTFCDYRPYVFHGQNNTVRLEFGLTSFVNPLEDEVQLDTGV